MMDLAFDRDFDAPHGRLVQVSPLIWRLLAPNPGPFTFRGTGVAIVGRNQVAVIDPGPDDPVHLQSLRESLQGRQVSHIIVTHTHRDHSPAAAALKQWTGAKTFGFGPHSGGVGPSGEEGADRDFSPDISVRDGDVIDGNGFTLQCVHTPGHTSNHVCYALTEEAALFSGDHVMGWSTTVVAPPDGDMAAYIASLRKLLSRDDRVYWPTHGGAIRDPKEFVSALLRHRMAREAEILAALNAGLTAIPAIAHRVYAGLDPRLRRAAELNVLAHLLKLIRDGRAVSNGTDVAATYRPTR